MSPSRSRKGFVPARHKHEVRIAVAVSAGIILGTILLIWLMRPGPTGIPGQGGLLARQPRMTILLIIAAVVVVGYIAFSARRRQGSRLGSKGAIAMGVVVIFGLAFVAGVFWPGGVVRHWPARPKIADTPTTNPASIPSSTVPPTAATPTTKAR
jgi:peptidoglycan biosynthesis protein MviN/MurJ (putative lipid II flippase)